MATTPTTELDFDAIKSDIIAYIKSNPTYTDYNFEGSALNAIVDMLAYNTHTNAYYANMLHSEGFLDTAQKRSSVVSKAKELGYTPRSSVCSSAFVDLTLTGLVPVTISRGTVFTSSNDNGTYSFSSVDSVTSKTVGANQVFSSLKLINGTPLQNYFTVDTGSNIRSIFTIPNKNVDTSTLKVYIRDSISSIDQSEYLLTDNAFGLTSTSAVYFLQESYDGYFQIYFGDDIIGKQPVTGNVIYVDYFTNDSTTLANDCRLFSYSGTFGTGSLSIVTTQVAFGGADKEAISSIKLNAVKSNSAKGRSVTTNDYEILLKEKFNFIKSAAIWGGEDNIPPVYGKVFISVQPISGYVVTDSVKKDVLTPIIKSTSLMTISPVFVDPDYINLDILTKIKFNPTKAVFMQTDIEGMVKATVSAYVSSISTFNSDYLESNLSSQISSIGGGIVSVDIDTYVSYRISPIIGIETTHNKNLVNAITPGSLTSTKFNIFYNGAVTQVSIKEIFGSDSTSIINNTSQTKIRLGIYSESDVFIKDIGYVNIDTGEINFNIGLYSYISSSTFISVKCALVSKDIILSRNKILMFDSVPADAMIGLLDNNRVTTEIYSK